MTKEFEAALQAKLVGHTGLSAIVGDRIWPATLDSQSAAVFPYIERLYGYTSEPTLDEPLAEITMQAVFGCRALDPDQLLDINAQMKDCLSGFFGNLGGIEVRSMLFQSYNPANTEKSAGQPIFTALITYTAALNL